MLVSSSKILQDHVIYIEEQFLTIKIFFLSLQMVAIKVVADSHVCFRNGLLGGTKLPQADATRLEISKISSSNKTLHFGLFLAYMEDTVQKVKVESWWPPLKHNLWYLCYHAWWTLVLDYHVFLLNCKDIQPNSGPFGLLRLSRSQSSDRLAS